MGVIVGSMSIVAFRDKTMFSFPFLSFLFPPLSPFVLREMAGRLMKVGVHTGLGWLSWTEPC